ncbi:MAG: shikimate dehydrogenase [Bacteroidales bacterium]|nr:shikimate dehydrogenase [Bacteroidales bacterium]
MRHYGLIGQPLAHSHSPSIFARYCGSHGIDDCRYSLYPLVAEQTGYEALHSWVADNDIRGFNVTIPYKKNILSSLDSLSTEASAIGAVNCVEVSRQAGGVVLKGHNTDAPAFEQTLCPLLRPHHRSALVMGTGGAAEAVAYALRRLGIDYCFVSRNPSRSAHPGQTLTYGQAIEQVDYRCLLINATPVGMMPYDDASPWPEPELLSPRHLCYDLVYNPAPTLFLSEAAHQGAAVFGGAAMLYRQAELSYQIWHL